MNTEQTEIDMLGTPPPETNAQRRNGQQSKFAAHNALIVKLYEQWPNRSGKNIAFRAAFEATPGLAEQLGVHNDRDLHSLEQHCYKVILKSKGLPLPAYLSEKRTYNDRPAAPPAIGKTPAERSRIWRARKRTEAARAAAMAGRERRRDEREEARHERERKRKARAYAAQKLAAAGTPHNPSPQRETPAPAPAPAEPAAPMLMANHCWHCGAPQVEVNQALAVKYAMKGANAPIA